MPQNSVKTSPRSSDVRERVLAAALHLFTKQGYFNTSVPDIVRASGCSTGSIYHHFGDKEGIAKALFEGLVVRIDAAFDDIENQYSSSEDRCRAVIELLFRITEEEPDVMEFMLYAKHKEFLPDLNPICSARPFQKMREFVSRGMATGEVRPMDAMVAAASVYGGALRMIHLRLDGVLEHSLLEKLDDIWKCAWRSVAV
jgi:AcrR family transcriptional regulator